jgi:hypothetical protein
MKTLALGFIAALVVAAPAPAAVVMFETPSRNIGCAVAKFGARCDIREHAWKPPPKPDSCHLDWGFGLAVDRTGFGHWVCAGDTVLGAKRVLGYGKSIRRGRFECTSRRNGVRCVNQRNSHGFKLSRRVARWF